MVNLYLLGKRGESHPSDIHNLHVGNPTMRYIRSLAYPVVTAGLVKLGRRACVQVILFSNRKFVNAFKSDRNIPYLFSPVS